MQKQERTVAELFGWIEGLPAAVVLAASFLLALLVGWIDTWTAFEISLSFFYLIPVTLATWRSGESWGLLLSALCAGISLLASLLPGSSNPGVFVAMWNVAVRYAIFLFVTMLLSSLRSHLQTESRLARTDYLTGALNSRAFYEVARMELERARRYKRPLSIAYIDLDDFKEINDQFGHSIGDAVIRTVSRVISANIRTVDVLARLGGDEFVVLLPETGPEAETLMERLHSVLLTELEKGSWDTGVSMGAITFLSQPRSVDELVYLADELMYKVKKGSKNAIAFSIYQQQVKAGA
jgi:diguanylate cyclase (GGDEF)-like protein